MPDQKFIDQPCTPLKPTGEPGPPKFLQIEEKCNATEDEVGYVSFTVEANPVPKVSFTKGNFPIPDSGRYAYLTQGGTSEIHLGIRKIKSNDEGVYTATISNEHGSISQNIELFVSPKGGMDMRQMLKKKKKPPEAKKPDEFEGPLVDTSCRQGIDRQIEFQATFSRSLGPEEVPKWTFNGQELVPGERHQMSSENGLHKLTILNPRPSDAGAYALQLNDITTEANLSVTPEPVKDQAPGKLLSPLKDKYSGMDGKELVLEAKVSPGPYNVTWLHGGKPLPKGKSDQYVETHDPETGLCQLRILCPKLGDHDGAYTIRVDPDGAESSTNVQISSAGRLTRGLEGPYVVANGADLEMEVEVENETTQVEWKGAGFDIEDPRVEIISEGKIRKLKISGARMSDAGRIVVKTDTGVESSSELIVQYGVELRKDLHKSVVGKERGSVELEVLTSGGPVGSIQWFRNGRKLPASEKWEVYSSPEDGVFRLKGNQLKLGDAGEFHAEFDGGQLSTTHCTLSVTEAETAPEISNSLSEGTTLTLNLPQPPQKLSIPYSVGGVRGSAVQAELLKDGVPTGWWDVNVLKDQVSLELRAGPSRRREVSGKYTLKVWNAEGLSQRNFNIKVLDVPSQPESVDVSEVNENSCILTWKPPVDDGGSKLKGYVLERRCVSQKGSWEQFETVGPTSTSFAVQDLTCGERYMFRIRAENEVGLSEGGSNNRTITAQNPFGGGQMMAPLFVLKPCGQVVVCGVSCVVFKAKVRGSPTPDVNWSYHGLELRQSMKYMKKNLGGGEWCFIVNKASLEDRGEYRFTAQNHLGIATASAQLLVQQIGFGGEDGVGQKGPMDLDWRSYSATDRCYLGGTGGSRLGSCPVEGLKDMAPVIQWPLRDRLIQAGQSCKLVTVVEGRPPPQVRWTKGGEVLSGCGNGYNLKISDTVVSLELLNPTLADSGLYRLEVSNYLGKTRSECNVLVE